MNKYKNSELIGEKFVYYELSVFSILFLITIGLLLTFSVLAGIKYGITGFLFIFCVFVPFFLFAMIVTLSNLSDITLSDYGVRRSFLRWTWKYVEWEKIECITIKNTLRNGGKIGKDFLVISLCKNDPSSKVKSFIIDTNVDMKVRFISKMNCYVKKHRILINKIVEDEIIKCDELQ